jgi:flagellin-like hook-associated protein FlgL
VIDEPGLKATGSLQSSFDPENLTVTDPDAFAALMRRTGDISVEVDQYFDGTDTTYSYSLRDSAGNIIEDSQGNPLQTQFYDATAVPLIQLDGASLELDLPIPVTGTPGVRGTDLTSTEETSLNVLDADAYTNLMRQAGGEILIRSEEDLLNPGTYLYKAYAANGIDELTDGAVPTPAPLLTVSPPVAPDVEPTLTFTDATGTPALEFEKDAVADATTAEVSMQFVPPADLKLSFSQPPSNILNTLLDTIELMREPVVGNAQAQTELQERFAKTLDQISLSQERLSEATATLGSRLNTLDDAEMSNTDFKLMTEGTLSSVQDLDYAAAGTELTKRKLALEAAYASFAKIQDLSLFNYIR